MRVNSDRTDECRPYEQSAKREVSVPLGFGANTTDAKRVATPPGRMLVSHEGV